MCPLKAGRYILIKALIALTRVEKGHSKGCVFIYFDWLEWWACSLAGKFISPLWGKALENHLFHQYSCPSYLWASEILSHHWALGADVKKSHLALKHSSVHGWDDACSITPSMECMLYHCEGWAFWNDQIWAESSFNLKLVFCCLSPGVVLLPRWWWEKWLRAVSLCCTSLRLPWTLPLLPHALFPLQMWIPPSPARPSGECPGRVLGHVFRNERCVNPVCSLMRLNSGSEDPIFFLFIIPDNLDSRGAFDTIVTVMQFVVNSIFYCISVLSSPNTIN